MPSAHVTRIQQRNLSAHRKWAHHHIGKKTHLTGLTCAQLNLHQISWKGVCSPVRVFSMKLVNSSMLIILLLSGYYMIANSSAQATSNGSSLLTPLKQRQQANSVELDGAITPTVQSKLSQLLHFRDSSYSSSAVHTSTPRSSSSSGRQLDGASENNSSDNNFASLLSSLNDSQLSPESANHVEMVVSNSSSNLQQQKLFLLQQLSSTKRLFVRKLTNLIMNHEAKSIEPEIKVNSELLEGQMAIVPLLKAQTRAPSESDDDYEDGEQLFSLAPSISQEDDSAGNASDRARYSTSQVGKENSLTDGGKMVYEASTMGKPLALLMDASDNQWQASTSTDWLDPDDEMTATATASSVLLQRDQAASSTLPPVASTTSENSEQSTPTCPPDYDDQGSASSALDEARSALNITSELERQQLFELVNASGLLPTQTGDRRECYSASTRMIEVITGTITPILFGIIIVVGLLGNIIVMIVILEDRKTERELTPTGLLILDLSLADLSFIIFCIPFTGWDYSVGSWIFGSIWCKCTQYLIVVCALSSIYTLVLMSLDRFLAIVYPIECMPYRTSKNTLYAIYIKWIVILLAASPTIPMHGLLDSPYGGCNCRFLSEQYNPLHFQIVFFITSYLFPLILIFCLYLSLLNKLWFGTKPHGHKESVKMLESKKKVTWLVAGIVVVFALCWCPIQVMLILMRLKTHRITATYVAIQVFSHTLGYMNSCVNPIVYAFASETFHNSFKRSSVGRYCYMCFCITNNHHNQQHQHQQQQPQQLQHHQPDHDRSTNFRAIHNDHNHNNTTILIDTQFHDATLNHEQNSMHKATGAGIPTGSNLTDFEANGNNNNNNNNNNNTTTTTNNSNNGSNNSNSTLLSATLHSNNELILYNNNNTSGSSSSSSKINILPLEPRDRMVLIQSPGGFKTESELLPSSPSPASSPPHSHLHSSSVHPASSPISPLQKDQSSQLSSSSGAQTNIDPSLGKGPTKQQIVARIVPSGKTISQRCEPSTYQQELGNSCTR